MIIYGNVVGNVSPRANWNQDDPTKADYIKGKDILREEISDAEREAKNYADSLHLLANVELPASGWSEAAPYTQSVAVEGILATDTPHYGVVYSADTATALAQKEAFAMVDDLDTADGSVTFTCFEDKPAVDLTIQMEVNR
jgi:hypothetical protein